MTRLVGLVLALAALGGPSASAADGPRLVIEPESFDFGEALPQRTLAKEFRLSNQGDEDLRIEKVATSCGCTVVGTYDAVIAPGRATTIRVSLDTRDDRGPLRRRVLVRSNDPGRQPRVIELAVTVVEPEASGSE